MLAWRKRTRSASQTSFEEGSGFKRRKTDKLPTQSRKSLVVPSTQSTYSLKALRTPYIVSRDQDVPVVHNDVELLIKVKAIGLNPIDWKAVDYGFGIPQLPYTAGREFAGVVVKAQKARGSRIQQGDIVAVPSTDYRDLRKAAFQEYSIASSFNAIRIPKHISINSGSILGVAFVSAALALGICMGLDFSSIEDGPDLLSMVHSLNQETLPSDIREECLRGIAKRERARSGDFLVVWGGSSTCAHAAKQIARLAGMKIISIVDSAKHGLRISSTNAIRPDLLVDSHDPDRAIEIVKRSTGGGARFGLDTQGKDTAGHLLRSFALPAPELAKLPMDSNTSTRVTTKLPSPPSTPLNGKSAFNRSHLVGLTGLPKSDIPDGVALHHVPIKLFHEVPEVGEALSAWCERLLAKKLLVPPDVVGIVEGLDGINEGLDRMRRREISGGRLVAKLEQGKQAAATQR